MSGEDTIKAQREANGVVVEVLPDGSTRSLPGETDWQRLAAMTEEEIEAAAADDPDNPPLTPEELAQMRPVPDPKQIRRRLGMTQERFAATFGVPLGTLRDWEQGARQPDSAAKTLLRVIANDPEAVIRALKV